MKRLEKPNTNAEPWKAQSTTLTLILFSVLLRSDKSASYSQLAAILLLTSYWLNSRKIHSIFGTGCQADMTKLNALLFVPSNA